MRRIQRAKWNHVSSTCYMIEEILHVINYFEHEGRFTYDKGGNGLVKISDKNKGVCEGILEINDIPKFDPKELSEYFNEMESVGITRATSTQMVFKTDEIYFLFDFYRGSIEMTAKNEQLNARFVMEIGMLFGNLPDEVDNQEFIFSSEKFDQMED